MRDRNVLEFIPRISALGFKVTAQNGFLTYECHPGGAIV